MNSISASSTDPLRRLSMRFGEAKVGARDRLNNDKVATSMDHVCRLIDRGVQDFTECIYTKKSRRNTYTPVSKLPHELLCIIFSFYQHHLRQLYGRPNVAWIIVSHVSNAWRDAALNSANLWTDIPLSCPKWIPEMMKRSQNVNLTISLTFSRDSFNAFCNVIRTDSHRVCELTLKKINTEHVLEDAFKDVPHSSMSRLQSLAITASNYPRHDENFDTLRFVEKYIGDSSDLRRVDLFSTVAWDSRILSDLTHLTIRNELMVERPTSTQFFNAIRRMPRLQELRLYGVVLPRCISVLTPAADDTIELPLLRVLILRGTSLEAANVLRHLRLLPYCSIDIECSRSESSPSDSAGLMSSLPNIYFAPPSSDTNPVPSMKFLQRLTPRLKIQFWTSLASRVPLIDPLPNHSPFLAIKVYCCAFIPGLTENIRRTIIGAVSYQNLTTLSLASDVPPGLLEDYTFLDALGQQLILEDIHVETGFIKQFLDYMTTRTDASNIPFPALRFVRFSGIDYQRGRSQPFPVQDLQRFVHQRKELGIGLQRLTIEHCCLLTTIDIELLRNSVDEVSCGVDDSAYELEGAGNLNSVNKSLISVGSQRSSGN